MLGGETLLRWFRLFIFRKFIILTHFWVKNSLFGCFCDGALENHFEIEFVSCIWGKMVTRGGFVMKSYFLFWARNSLENRRLWPPLNWVRKEILSLCWRGLDKTKPPQNRNVKKQHLMLTKMGKTKPSPKGRPAKKQHLARPDMMRRNHRKIGTSAHLVEMVVSWGNLAKFQRMGSTSLLSPSGGPEILLLGGFAGPKSVFFGGFVCPNSGNVHFHSENVHFHSENVHFHTTLTFLHQDVQFGVCCRWFRWAKVFRAKTRRK